MVPTIPAIANAIYDAIGIRVGAPPYTSEKSTWRCWMPGEGDAAGANDLVIAIRAAQEALDGSLVEAERLLQKKLPVAETGAMRPKTLRAARKLAPEANLCVISVAGRYAVVEAFDALRNNMNVLLFSDNVSLEDEVALKQYATEHSLFLMGPGAGTAIIDGVALGFANVLPSGPVGLVSAAGTGLQEVSTLLAKRGIGITQGLGVGGRDLSEEVGGLMMLSGLRALQADSTTRIIVLISKPPSPIVSQKVIAQAAAGSKPTVVCFLGCSLDHLPDGVIAARTLDEAAWQAARIEKPGLVAPFTQDAEKQAISLRLKFHQSQRYLRGLYSGGTLCYEAQVIWRDMLADPVLSNVPHDRSFSLSDPTHSERHSAVDLGEEEFTVGRLHPMLDNGLRIRRILQEAQDPEVAVIVIDVVLGYGAHPNPASELAPAILQARARAAEKGRELVFAASITGTQMDPQPWEEQVERLQAVGVHLFESNALAARFAGLLVKA
jgi:FdrA protein